MADALDLFEEELMAAPCLDGVRENFAKTAVTLMEKSGVPKDDTCWMLGLAWGEHPDTKKKGLRYTTILKIPTGTKQIASPTKGVAWLIGLGRRPDGSTAPFGNNTILHDDSCRSAHGGRAWECNCISEILINEIPSHA